MTDRVLGERGSNRRKRFLFLPFLVTAAFALAALAISGGAVANTASCTSTATLGDAPDGSAFEIDANANLIVSTTGCIDWLTGGTGTSFRTGVLAKNDQPTGTGDDSFGQGTAENNPNPTIVSGSIPPNKSDLKAFGVFTEDDFLELFWSRVQNPSGTTNMDFELNRLFCDGTATNCANNGSNKNPVYVTPKRSAGDKLITYDLSQGGTNPAISVRTWVTSGKAQWSDPVVISGGSDPDALGSVNTTVIPATDTGGETGGLTASLGSQDPFTFGEAAISFEALFGEGSCGTFGSAYLKSRSSDSFTAEIKDFVAPERVNVSNCPSTIQTAQSVIPNDSATVGGGGGGSVRFRLYSTSDCSGTALVDQTKTLDSNGQAATTNTTVSVSTSATYKWLVEYLGDSTHLPVTSTCGTENLVVTFNNG